MKYSFKTTLFTAICFLLLLSAGCKTSVEMVLDAMEKPVYIAAISQDGNVLLRDSKGDVLQINAYYYMAKSIAGSGLKNGDLLIPKVLVN